MKCLIAILLLTSSNSFAPNVIRQPIRSVPLYPTRLYSTIEPSPTTPPTDEPTTPVPEAVSTTETPVVETPTAEAPAVEAPTAEAPAVETPTAEAPVVEAPAGETPAVETPTGEAPAAATPVAKPGMASEQEKYGISLDMPDTYVRCGRCATAFAIKMEDLGPRGRRIACSVCTHSWYQTPDRLFNLKEGNKLSPLPVHEKDRISKNLEAGRDPDFIGKTKFYVGNLDFSVTEDDLRKLFSEMGPVGSVSMAVGPDGRVKGFAFVTMMDEGDLDACLALDGKDLNGRNINVKPPINN